MNGPILLSRFQAVRRATETLCATLEVEDYVAQSMPDVSPTKWHLAHVSWFFETFVLVPSSPGYLRFDAAFESLFNSYYQSVGTPFPRTARGTITRPTVAQVLAYRRHVDQAMARLLSVSPDDGVLRVVELGLHHEQQHQELMLMDLLHVFAQNPTCPIYREGPLHPATPSQQQFEGILGGDAQVGSPEDGFCFDNETPRHRVALQDFELSRRLVSNGEYLEFMQDGAYASPLLWLSDGFTLARSEGWQAPAYWTRKGDDWFEFTLRGLVPLDLAAPVVHVSFFEAEAFATWAGARLPTEHEWEAAAASVSSVGNFVESGRLHPDSPPLGTGTAQLFGDAWEWTRSAYEPYPGFKVRDGALGEYNGKFMIGQQVVRGGACVTPESHIRLSYRNFFYPHQRWMFSGIRLAR